MESHGDRADVLHWRLDRICKHQGIDPRELHGRLEILDLVGHDAILYRRDFQSGASLTAAYDELRQRMDSASSSSFAAASLLEATNTMTRRASRRGGMRFMRTRSFFYKPCPDNDHRRGGALCESPRHIVSRGCGRRSESTVAGILI